ncbi:hypothetical protein [Lederbergia lenta]|nr:hypothetical protein [Lederbergia lenta]MCM3109911.1 hypothetical protein [Lederbergia lenta]
MNDQLLENLGDYFVKRNIKNTYGWTFEEFVDKHNREALDWLYEFDVMI